VVTLPDGIIGECSPASPGQLCSGLNVGKGSSVSLPVGLSGGGDK
jgi:hypothetical protein